MSIRKHKPAKGSRAEGASLIEAHTHTTYYDVIVVGGGPAGMAAAYAASKAGAEQVLIIEREPVLGGVLPQCVHDGFGLHLYGDSKTGPEYAQLWIDMLKSEAIEVALSTTALAVQQKEDQLFIVKVIGPAFNGPATLTTKSLVCATGCRERTRGALIIPGGRPAGILPAGTAQYMVNVANQLPGDKVVVLGSGDIGLIMARRMALEGAEVRMVLGQEATGLMRNYIRCVRDFDIPLRFGWGVVSVHGYGQLQGITIAPLDETGVFDLSQKEYIRCNVLLIACGLIPEREVLKEIDNYENAAGLFLCGNARTPHDLVDQVTQEGIRTGFEAACFARQSLDSRPVLPPDLQELVATKVEEAKNEITGFMTYDDTVRQPIICTLCPKGCVLHVSDNGEVEGACCEKGNNYALNELDCPIRMFTGTVKWIGDGQTRLLPVRTSKEVPRDRLQTIARICKKLKISGSVKQGEILVSRLANTDADLIAATSVTESQ